jgi:hypothetical protein
MQRWILRIKRSFLVSGKSPNLTCNSLFKLLLHGWAFPDPSSTTLRPQELDFLATIYLTPIMFMLFLALWRFCKTHLFIYLFYLFILFIVDITCEAHGLNAAMG